MLGNILSTPQVISIATIVCFDDFQDIALFPRVKMYYVCDRALWGSKR